jgi:hypothetical protein
VLVLCLFLATFEPGERLTYDVRYGPVTLGRMELCALDPDTIDVETCYRFAANLETNRSLALVFDARYGLLSWVRPADFTTLRSYKDTEERNYEAEVQADFDYGRKVIRYSDGKTYPLAGPCRDLLTLWYFFRQAELEPGDVISLYSHVDRKDYRVKVRAARYEKVRVPAGVFRCVVVVPSTAGPLGTVYLDEQSRIPVVIRTRVAGMTVSALLREVE